MFFADLNVSECCLTCKLMLVNFLLTAAYFGGKGFSSPTLTQVSRVEEVETFPVIPSPKVAPRLRIFNSIIYRIYLIPGLTPLTHPFEPFCSRESESLPAQPVRQRPPLRRRNMGIFPSPVRDMYSRGWYASEGIARRRSRQENGGGGGSRGPYKPVTQSVDFGCIDKSPLL